MKTKQPSRISSVNTKVTDDEFDELCSLIQDIGYVYINKKLKRKSTRKVRFIGHHTLVFGEKAFCF